MTATSPPELAPLVGPPFDGDPAWRAHSTLADVTRVVLRPMSAEDRDELRRAYRDELSPKTRYLRFLGFMGERVAEGFGSIEEAAAAVAAYLPHRKPPRSLEGLKKNLRLHPDGRWRWHWDPRFLTGPSHDPAFTARPPTVRPRE